MGTKLQASFLIVNFNSQKEVLRLISEIAEKFKDSYELLIFDCSSNLNKDPINAKVFDLGKNIGFGAAHNYLSMQAKGKYLFILNPDVTIKYPLDATLQEFINQPLEYAVYSLNLPEKLHTTPFIGRFITKNTRFSSHAFIVYKEYFDILGGFDPHFFMYFEDNDFALKLKNFGLKTYYTKPLVEHIQNYGVIKGLERKYFYYDSFLYFLKKNYFLKYLIFFVPLNICKLLTKNFK